MADRRAQLLDAAVEVVAERGLGRLSHDAVDATALVPAGSTLQQFPTDRALLEGLTQRCIDRELEMAAGLDPTIEPSPDGIAAMFGQFVHRALGADRAVTLTRYQLHAEVARTPSLRTSYAVGADTVDTWAVDLVERAGSHHPARDFGILANYATGLVFHELALPSPDLDAAGRIRSIIDALQWSAS